MLKKLNEATEGFFDPITSALQKGAKDLVGKTNLTKVNTTQVFLSTESVRLNATIGFIAFANAETEVENNIMLLESWTVPRELADKTVLNQTLNNGLSGLFPSVIPHFVSVTIHGRTYTPFILGTLSEPLGVPTEINGNRLNCQLNLSLFSKTAWDARDVLNFYKR